MMAILESALVQHAAQVVTIAAGIILANALLSLWRKLVK